jgi:hypothetical protein
LLGIEKIRFSDNFFKGEKAAPAQVRIPNAFGTAVEAKHTAIKEFNKEAGREELYQ